MPLLLAFLLVLLTAALAVRLSPWPLASSSPSFPGPGWPWG